MTIDGVVYVVAVRLRYAHQPDDTQIMTAAGYGLLPLSFAESEQQQHPEAVVDVAIDGTHYVANKWTSISEAA